MRFLRNLFLFVVVVIVLLVGGAFLLPGTTHVERSIAINRPASEVFAILNSYRRFNEWSPWAAKDPNAKYTISGPAFGKGAKQSWVGDPKTVGSGSQQIVESTPNQSVATELEFTGMGQARARYTLTQGTASGSTKVVWSFDSDTPLAFDGQLVHNAIGRYMGLFMDKMIGPDFEQGLARLKTLLEGLPAADIAGVQGDELEHAAQKIYYVSASSGADAESAKAALTDAFAKLSAFVQSHEITVQGSPLTITDSNDASGWKFDAALPVERNDVPPSGEIRSGETYAGKTVQFMHIGPNEQLGDALQKAYAWLAVQGYKPKGRPIAEYVSDPATTPAEKLLTVIYIPVE